jgi:isoleucyl-tRNA synthetase
MVPYEKMPEIDRWAMHQLELLKEKVTAAYDDCEFHVLYHAVNAFCTVEMSAFYLDILKDRVYTSRKDSLERRSAQSAMYQILDTLVRLIAPVLSFTADEIWGYMPKPEVSSVHLAQFPPLRPEHRDDSLVERWGRIIKVRADVSKALELARVNKIIGHSLDAKVTINAAEADVNFLKNYAATLKDIFIVSSVDLLSTIKPDTGYASETIEGLRILVEAAPGQKCERCWTYDESIGSSSEFTTICPRCIEAVR